MIRWFYKGAINKLLSNLFKPIFLSCGRNVNYSACSSNIKPYKNISIGNDVYIAGGATFLCTDSKIFIGNKVLLGPNVTIIGGDHRASEIGRYIYDIHDKNPEDDKDIFIDDDVWVATGSIILKGVTVGRGAIIAAGALVKKNIPPYAIVGGVPAKILKFRFTIEEILKHEELLYEEENRYTIQDLEEIQIRHLQL